MTAAIPVLVQYEPTPAPAPERVEAPTVATHLWRDGGSPSGWSRRQLTEAEVATFCPQNVLHSWDAWNPTEWPRDEVVVRDGIGR